MRLTVEELELVKLQPVRKGFHLGRVLPDERGGRADGLERRNLHTAPALVETVGVDVENAPLGLRSVPSDPSDDLPVWSVPVDGG